MVFIKESKHIEQEVISGIICDSCKKKKLTNGSIPEDWIFCDIRQALYLDTESFHVCSPICFIKLLKINHPLSPGGLDDDSYDDDLKDTFMVSVSSFNIGFCRKFINLTKEK